MKITLQVKGREMTFSEQELIAIVEKHLSNETIQQVTTAKVAQKPTEGEWFEVKPLTIDQGLFQKERKDTKQEATRLFILEAFLVMENDPKRYGRNFKTMIPKKTWKSKNGQNQKKMAMELGDHNADWVEQTLEWAQRIANGESWESICNDPDTAKWYRSIIWKDGYTKLIGGSVRSGNHYPASNVYNQDYRDLLYHAVPLVVSYE